MYSLLNINNIELNLEGLDQHWQRNSVRYFIIALVGKIKGEIVDRSHLILCTNNTLSGINVGETGKRLIVLKAVQAFKRGRFGYI